MAVWLGLGLRSAAADVRAHADSAQTSLEETRRHLLAGDLAAARASTEVARQQVADAARSADAVPVRLAGRVPVVGTAVDDLDLLIAAATDLADASAEVVDVYATISGSGDQGRLFADGRVDLAMVAQVRTSVSTALGLTNRARESLTSVRASVPGTGSMASARDTALAQVEPLGEQLAALSTVMERLPAALGEASPKNYLVVTLNPAELFAGGGAALAAAVVRFDDGEMSLPVQGSVSTALFPGNPSVAWDHVSSEPFFTPRQPAGFAWSNLHPDFTVTAREMQRAWVANGMKPVDGVIALDPVALSAALKVIGPVSTADYGEITAGNLVRKLLIDAYADFSADQGARHELNEALMASVLGRLTSGEGALDLGRALAATSAGGHFRVFFDDPALEGVVESAGLSGRLPAAGGGDVVALYSQNQNASKVDIFQSRTVTHDVRIAADGSADAVTTMVAAYDVPSRARTSEERRGYLSRWSFNWYYAYLPLGAELVEHTAPRNDARDPADDPAVYEDVDGWRVVRVGRWTAAGASTTVTTSYHFPAGTFASGGALAYTLRTAPQAMLAPMDLAVSVSGPGIAALDASTLDGWVLDGETARWTGELGVASTSTLTWP
jgi:hypothetical protein